MRLAERRSWPLAPTSEQARAQLLAGPDAKIRDLARRRTLLLRRVAGPGAARILLVALLRGEQALLERDAAGIGRRVLGDAAKVRVLGGRDVPALLRDTGEQRERDERRRERPPAAHGFGDRRRRTYFAAASAASSAARSK